MVRYNIENIWWGFWVFLGLKEGYMLVITQSKKKKSCHRFCTIFFGKYHHGTSRQDGWVFFKNLFNEGLSTFVGSRGLHAFYLPVKYKTQHKRPVILEFQLLSPGDIFLKCFLFRFRVTITFKGGVIQLHSCFVLVYILDISHTARFTSPFPHFALII